MSGLGVRMSRRLAIIAGCALVMAPPALAHRSQTVLTTVMWNAERSILEVTHRVHTADAEAWLQVAGSASTDITLVRNQAQLMMYLEDHFALFDGARKILLQALGAELDGEAILFYQECKMALPPKELSIDNRILRDVFEGQANLVNVRLAQRTRSLVFAGAEGRKQADGLY